MFIQIKNYLQAKTNLVSFKHICSMKVCTITFSNGNNGDKTTPDATSNLAPTIYEGAFEYLGDVLQRIGIEEGQLIRDASGNYTAQYYLKDHLGSVRQVISETGTVLQETEYYPFGLPIVRNGGAANKYLYNGKEVQPSTNWQDYGARMYMADVGRWFRIDPLAEKYFGQSSYNYVHNNPVNAIDPDGRLVIFVNGQGPSNPLNNYWGGFDKSVMNQLKDNHWQYYDGSIGGWGSTLGGGIFTGLGNNLSSSNRYDAGFDKGYEDAASLIANLARDKEGNITETIKIITHSMGGVFGNGLQNGILKYLKEHPELAEQVKISLVAHFDPFQASDITANSNIYTMQFKHRYGIINDKNGTRRRNDADGLWWLANEDVNGADVNITDPNESGHGIGTFLNNVTNLREGTYTWNGSQWICQTCK